MNYSSIYYRYQVLSQVPKFQTSEFQSLKVSNIQVVKLDIFEHAGYHNVGILRGTIMFDDLKDSKF